MAECRSCGKPIEWVVIAKSGKKMPLDPRPAADGNIAYLASSEGESGLPQVEYVPTLPGGAQVPEKGARAVFPTIAGAVDPQGARARYKSHFATCVDAEKHRR